MVGMEMSWRLRNVPLGSIGFLEFIGRPLRMRVDANDPLEKSDTT